MNPIFQDIEDKKYYVQIKPVGSWDRDNCRHYSLWQPVKRFLKFFFINSGKQFWLEQWPTLKPYIWKWRG